MTELSGINGNTVESDVINQGNVFVALLVPTLCVGTRVLDSHRPVGCHARFRHEATPSVEEGVPTPERGNENPSPKAISSCRLFNSIGINGDEMMTLEHQDLTERIIWSHHTVNIPTATRRRIGSIARTPQ